jgi:hypothetical protein
MVIIALYLWSIRAKLLAPVDPGTAQSVKNALDGFPSGADPGTVPIAQYMQGLFESGRTLSNDVWGTSGPDPGSATVDQADAALAAYQPPSYSQLQSAYTQAPVAINNFLNTIQTNPGSLPIF